MFKGCNTRRRGEEPDMQCGHAYGGGRAVLGDGNDPIYFTLLLEAQPYIFPSRFIFVLPWTPELVQV
jgi:hypothetical protein